MNRGSPVQSSPFGAAPGAAVPARLEADGYERVQAHIARLARFEFSSNGGTPVATVVQREDRVEVETRDGDGFAARAAIVAVPLNALGAIEFTPPLSEDKRRAIALGQASRGIKIFIRARGEPVAHNAVRPHHEFGYLGTDWINGDGSQILIGFGADAERCKADAHGVRDDPERKVTPGRESEQREHEQDQRQRHARAPADTNLPFRRRTLPLAFCAKYGAIVSNHRPQATTRGRWHPRPRKDAALMRTS